MTPSFHVSVPNIDHLAGSAICVLVAFSFFAALTLSFRKSPWARRVAFLICLRQWSPDEQHDWAVRGTFLLTTIILGLMLAYLSFVALGLHFGFVTMELT